MIPPGAPTTHLYSLSPGSLQIFFKVHAHPHPPFLNPVTRVLALPISIAQRKDCVSRSVVSSSWQPHGLQPARPLCPWDSPSKNTGVGCHSLRQGIFPTQGPNLALLYCRWILHCLSHQGSPQCYAVLCLVAQSCLSLWDSAAHGLLCPWDSPGQNTGVGCHALLQGIFPIQGANLCLLNRRRILYRLSYQRSPDCRL